MDFIFTFLYVTVSVLILCRLLFDKWYMTWLFYNYETAGGEVLTTILPVIGLAVIYPLALCMKAVGLSLTAKIIALALVLLACIASIIVAGIFTIKKYHNKGYRANVAAFIIVCVYAAVLFAGSVIFAL